MTAVDPHRSARQASTHRVGRASRQRCRARPCRNDELAIRCLDDLDPKRRIAVNSTGQGERSDLIKTGSRSHAAKLGGAPRVATVSIEMQRIPIARAAVEVEKDSLIVLTSRSEIHLYQKGSRPCLGSVVQELGTIASRATAAPVQASSRLSPAIELKHRGHSRDPSRWHSIVSPGCEIIVHHHATLLWRTLRLGRHHLLPISRLGFRTSPPQIQSPFPGGRS